MDTQTGDLRPLDAEADQHLPDVDVLRDVMRDLQTPVPPEVAVPASYLPLTPRQRLALAFGGTDRGKDRKAAHAGQAAKAKARRRKHR